MKNVNLKTLFAPIGALILRFNLILFILFVVACLGLAVLTLNSVFQGTSSAEGYISPIGAGTIDQATLDRVKELHTSDEQSSNVSFPGGRVNPFGE